MQLGLQGKVAVITGASRGIGNAIAQALLGEDCAVAICSRNASQLDAAVVELSAKGRVLGVATDVTDENAVKRLIAAVIEQFGRIDILVNNAGTHLRGTVETTTLDILDRQLREAVPTGLARGRQIVESGRGGLARRDPASGVRRDVRNERRRGRSTDLVGYDPQRIALARQLQDGSNEIVTTPRMHPAGAQDQ